MTNIIGHGHVYPRDDGYLAKCGGPATCNVCRDEMSHLNQHREGSAKLQTALDHFVSDVEAVTRTGFRTSEEMAGEPLPDPAEAATAAERARCIAMVQQALKEWPCVPSLSTRQFAAAVTKLIEGGES